eukprot:Tbor_TRINITY_DN3975_c0_g1::TRINITY_DN3975_c0_g1_i1::g.720::m.720
MKTSEDDRDMLDTQIRNLYKIIEVPNIDAVTSSVACDTLRLANPSISVEQTRTMVNACDEGKEGKLSVLQFSTLIRNGLDNMDPYDAAMMLKVLVSKMQMTFRRRLLTYDSPPNVLPKFLLGSSASYRQLFEKISKNDYITRQTFNEVVDGIFVHHTGSMSQAMQSLGNNIIKAAADTEDRRGFIGFNEFMMLLNVATNHMPISEIIRRGEEYIKNRRVHYETNNRISSLHYDAESSVGLPKSNNTSNNPGEIIEGSHRITQGIYGASQYLHMKPENLSNPRTLTTVGESDSVLELKEQLAKFAVEREELKAEIAKWKQKTCNDINQNDSNLLERDVAQQNSEPDANHRIAILENELRLCKSELGLANEAAELFNLLKRYSDPLEALRSHFLSEAPLIAKHRFLREKADIINVNSPQGLILGQYELLVCGYQALLRKKDEVKRCTSTQPSSFVHAKSSLSRSSVSRSSPSVSMNRCARVRASPFKWSEIDRAVSNDAWGTGTIADPILTQEERTNLRSKLATQMRSVARTKSPRLKVKERNHFSRQSEYSEQVTPGMTSHEAMMRLQSISSKATNNEWRI